jgi:hypothetical protein
MSAFFLVLVNKSYTSFYTQTLDVSFIAATTEGPCGAECLAGLVAGSFILVCSIIGLCFCWKYRSVVRVIESCIV